MSFEGDVTDNDLARLAQAGDDRAFARLVHRHKDSLYRLLRRYTGNADEAYEAAHEAFIAAWGALRRYDPERPFGAWLRTIAINKARDRGRRLAVRRLVFGARGLDDGKALASPDPAAAADQILVERQQADRLDQAISRLPPALKAPLLLTAFEGLSQQETGLILGISAKAVETRVRRARQRLADELNLTLGAAA